MTHTVTLTRQDQKTLLEALSASQEIKEKKKLKNPDSINAMNRQYYDAALKIIKPIVINKRDNNLMTWYIDQMKHTPRLWGTKLCEHACLIANRVIDDTYEEYKSIEVFEDLFKIQDV